MKDVKLVLSAEARELFEEWNHEGQIKGFGKIGTWETDYFIDGTNYLCCNISKFRKILHTVVDLYDYNEEAKETLHYHISSNNFTELIFRGILVVK